MGTAVTVGIHHLGLTVANVRQTAQFFTEQLGFAEIGGKPDYPSIFISDGNHMLTLWQASQPEQCRAFDRHNNIGLHHFALRVQDCNQLQNLHQQLLKQQDVTIEFGPEPLGNSTLQHMMCLIPGGLRVEFISA